MDTMIEVIETLPESPMPSWYWYQPEWTFRPYGIVIWGTGGLVHSLRIANIEHITAPVPVDAFNTEFPYEELRRRAVIGRLLRSLRTIHIDLPTVTPDKRVNVQVTGSPQKVAIFGIQRIITGNR